MEPAELFSCLESNQPPIVEDAKKKLHQTFNITKESWLLNGLFDYYLSTYSARAIEILISVREPHDKYLFDRLCDSLKNSATKLQALTILGHVLRRQPAWLYKITQHQLLKDILKLLKTETDILPLLSALLVIVVLLPMIPALIGPFLPDIFDIFSRLAAWNCNPGRLGEEQLVHLQVALYALFLRLYGMYPCNFLSYLRNHYRQGVNLPVFIHTLKPMLGTVKIHPHLVTASKDNETDSQRWKKMRHHDVIVECERFAIDLTSGAWRDDSPYTGLRSRSNTFSMASAAAAASTSVAAASTSAAAQEHHHQYHRATSASAAIQEHHHYHQQTVHEEHVRCTTEFWSPTVFLHTHTSSPPPVPEVRTPASIPHTPISQIPTAQNFVISSSFSQPEGASPPEAAIEATPETTPIKDPRISGRSLHHEYTPVSSNVVRALTTLHSSKWPGLTAASSSSTPSQSQPSSPMRKEPSPFRFPTEGSAFELSAANAARMQAAREPAVSQKILRLMHERSQAESPVTVQSSNARGKTPVPLTIPTSPLRVIPRYYETTSNVPNSPVPLGDGPAAGVARPRPEKNGCPVTPAADTSQEDQEVLEIVRQGELQTGATRAQLCDSVLQEFVSQPDDNEFEPGTECCGEPHDLKQGSPCSSGGLHMPNSHSLQIFRSRVHRLRYYSQCGPTHEPGTSDTSTESSPGQRDNHPPAAARVRRAHSCPEMKKHYHHTPDSSLGKAALDESDELDEERNLSNGVCEPRPPQKSTSTQTLDLWPMPYEHLFLGVFPFLDSNTEVRPSPSPSPAPVVLCDKNVRFSPYEMLDKFIEQASYSYEQDGKRSKVQSLENEIKNLREQLGLVHLQLQYERHRREVHAERNRRLLGESRNNKVLEEHNSALRDQVALLQKEIEHLNDELNTKKQELDHREKEHKTVVNYWHEQCTVFQEENTTFRSVNETLQRDLTAQVIRTTEETTSHQRTEADLFRLGAEMREMLERASHGDMLLAELEHTQRELLLAGEINQRFRERLAQWPLIEQKHEEAKQKAEAYHDEITVLNQQLELQWSIIEGQKAHLQELEGAITQSDDLCASQKRTLIEVKDQYKEEFSAVDSKYHTLQLVNRNLEERILELWQRVETIGNTGRGARTSHHSPDTSSCHEVGVTDRTGTGAAHSSPHSSSPLSASLASSEGSMAFQQTSTAQTEIKNLQVIVDQTDCAQFQEASVSEETTPDGNNPSFLYNQSD